MEEFDRVGRQVIDDDLLAARPVTISCARNVTPARRSRSTSDGRSATSRWIRF